MVRDIDTSFYVQTITQSSYGPSNMHTPALKYPPTFPSPYLGNLPALPHSSQEVILLDPSPSCFPHSRIQVLPRPLCIHALFQAHTSRQVNGLLLERDFDNVFRSVAASGQGSCSFRGKTSLLL